MSIGRPPDDPILAEGIFQTRTKLATIAKSNTRAFTSEIEEATRQEPRAKTDVSEVQCSRRCVFFEKIGHEELEINILTAKAKPQVEINR